MPSRADFVALSNKRLSEAETLLNAGQYEGAFYLAGYAVEFALKAVICKTLDIEIFTQSSDLQKGFMVHRIDYLIVWAGLSKKINDHASTDPRFQSAVNAFINPPSNIENWRAWTEKTRYNENPCPQPISTKFIQNVKIFTTWLAQYW